MRLDSSEWCEGQCGQVTIVALPSLQRMVLRTLQSSHNGAVVEIAANGAKDSAVKGQRARSLVLMEHEKHWQHAKRAEVANGFAA